MKEKGLIHIYEGEGKGKTTAAIGLAVRFAGAGGNVLFTQFLKKNTSGELAVLKKAEKIQLLLCEKNFGFTFQMTPEEKQEAAACYSGHLQKVLAAAGQMAERSRTGEMEHREGEPKTDHRTAPGILLVLDEILAVYNQNMINRQELLNFLKEKPENLELVMTGRNPAPELLEFADYVTVMEKKKHPYDRKIGARRGIEW